MASLDSSYFSCWDDVPDDSKFVYEAMASLGFVCEFSDLDISEMQLALELAVALKRAQGRTETLDS